MKAWREGRHIRSVHELEGWNLPPLAQDPDNNPLPEWAESALVMLILLLGIGTVLLVISWPVQ